MATPQFFMQRVDIQNQPVKNLEEDFPGLKYKEFKGLEKYGKNKGIYTETFAETDEVKVWIHPYPIRENIELTLTLVFIGSSRRATYHRFVNYISDGKIKYWDNVRKREVTFVLIEAIEPETDTLIGGADYIQASFKLTCLNGQAENV